MKRDSRQRRIGLPLALCLVGLMGKAAHAQTTPAPSTIPTSLPPSATAPPAPLPAPSLPIAPASDPLHASPTPELKTPLTLDQTIALALGVNPGIAQTDAALLTAEGQIGEEKASLGPKLGANFGVNGYSEGINAYRGDDEVARNAHAEPSLGAMATLPIDITGYLHAAADEAHFKAISARLDVNRQRNIVVGNVATAFFNVLRSQALVNVARENLRDSKTRLDDAQEKFKAQTVAILDVVRAQTDVANARQQLISAESAVSINLGRLNNAIGLDVRTEIEVSDAGAVEQPEGVPAPSVPPVTPAGPVGANGAPLPPPNSPNAETDLRADEAAAADVASKINADLGSASGLVQQAESGQSTQTPLGPDFDALVSEAEMTRPEILQSDADVLAAQKGIRYAQRSMLPQMQVGLRYEYAAQTFGTSVVLNNGQAFVGFTLPIIDAGLARSRVQEARGREADAVVAKRQMTDAVSLDVREAYLGLLDARARVAVANQALAQAREAFLLARVRYNAGVTAKAGVSPLLEVSDAQAAVVLAETNQVNAVYDYNAAHVRLNYAVGRYSYTPNGPGYATAPKPK